MKRKGLLILCGILIVILLLSEALILHHEGFDHVKTYKTVGKVIVWQEEHIPRSEIREVLVRDGKIYILYDTCGLVNVYSSAGAFQYGLQVSTSSNGKGDIAFAGDQLLIKARDNVIYVFDEAKLAYFIQFSYTEFAEKTESAAAYEALEAYFALAKPHEYQGKTYCISESGTTLLVCDASGVSTPVSFLPQRSNWSGFVLILTALSVMLFCVLWRRKA